MKHISLLIIILYSTFLTFAQDHPKVNFQLKQQIQSRASGEMIPFLIKGDIHTIKTKVQEAGGIFKYASGDIAAVEVPAEQIHKLSTEKNIYRMEYFSAPGHILNDTMLINNRIVQIHQGITPLPKEYTGKGVIMGYLDTGINIDHGDFKNPDGTTRIISIWDQAAQGAPPIGYNYGQEWRKTHIDNNQCTHKDPDWAYGHGTNVAGIGSGNGLAVNKYTGVAPESDIIMVAIDFNADFLPKVVDGIKYILDKAEQLDKPVVINTSLGTYFGSHDGKDLYAQAIDNMLKGKKKRVIVTAAGNAGEYYMHLGYNVTSDTSMTFFRYYNNLKATYFQLWADTADFNNVKFKLKALHNSNYTTRAQTTFFNIKNDFNLHIATNGFFTDTFKNASGQRIGIIDIYAERIDDSYMLDYVFYNDSTNYLLSFETTGSGYFDIWSHQNTTGTSNMVNSNLPSATVLPSIVNYKYPDRQQTMVSSWAALESVITVGNYENRKTHPAWDNTTYVNPLTPGILAPPSSIGPTRDNRIKPDITASGNSTLTAGIPYAINQFKVSNKVKLAPEGQHTQAGGTSMASPMVAGVAALYLEKYPDATFEQIKKAITISAFQDTFTGTNLPNSSWGYGKLNGFGAITLKRGCTNPNAPNYDSTAVIDDGSCQTPVGVVIIEKENFLKVYPNPATSSATIEYQLQHQQESQILIRNLVGTAVNNYSLQDQKGFINFDRNNLPSGIYFVQLISDNRLISTQKIVLQ